MMKRASQKQTCAIEIIRVREIRIYKHSHDILTVNRGNGRDRYSSVFKRTLLMRTTTM